MVRKNIYRDLLSDIFTYGFLDSLTRLFSFLLLPILTRIFSVEEYGAIDLIAAFSSFLLTFTTLGLPNSLARYYDNKKSHQYNATLFSSLQLFNLVFTFLIILLVYIFSRQLSVVITQDAQYAVYIRLASIATFFSSMSYLPFMLLRRRRKIRLFGTIKIVTTALYVGFTLLLVLVIEMGLEGVFLGQVLGYFIGFVMSIWVTRKHLIRAINLEEMKRSLRFSLPMFPSIFVSWANEQFNRFIIISMLNMFYLGVFGAAFRISKVIQILAQMFRKAWIPYSMEIIEEKSRGKIINGLMRYYMTFFLLLGLVFSMLAPEIIRVVLPGEYYSSYSLVPWLVGAFIIYHSGTIVNMGSIIKEKTVINSVAAWIGFGMNVLLCLLLIRPLGILGAAIGLFVANLLSNIILLWQTERITEIRFCKSYLMLLVTTYIVSNIAMLGLIRYVGNYYLSLMLRIFIVVGIFILIDRILWKNIISSVAVRSYHKMRSKTFSR